DIYCHNTMIERHAAWVHAVWRALIFETAALSPRGGVMALVECMDCKKEISKNAEKYPHCGAANAHLTAKTLLGCFGLIVVILVIGGFMSLCSTEKSDEEKEDARKEAEIADTECRKDAACWGEKHLRTAARHCKPKIER